MKIAVASDDGTHVTGHAGRAAGFVVAEFEGKTLKNREYRTSPFPGHAHAEHHHEGDHNHELSGGQMEKHAGIRAALSGCDALICGGMGHRLMTDLREGGIEVLLTSEQLVDVALQAWSVGTLVVSGEGFCRH